MDESYSKPLQIKMFAADKPNQLKSLMAQFEDEKSEGEAANSVGRIKVNWEIKEHKDVYQYSLEWHSVEEALSSRKVVGPELRSCYVPVTRSKCLYEITLEIIYNNRTSFSSDTLFVEIPGSPDPPEIWLKEQKDNVILVCWSNPRVYPTVPISGYQVSSDHLRPLVHPSIVHSTPHLDPAWFLPFFSSI